MTSGLEGPGMRLGVFVPTGGSNGRLEALSVLTLKAEAMSFDRPPEICGGIWSYYDMLDAIRDPDHPDHEEMLEWIEDFDPKAFDLDEANQR